MGRYRSLILFGHAALTYRFISLNNMMRIIMAVLLISFWSEASAFMTKDEWSKISIETIAYLVGYLERLMSYTGNE